MEEEEKVQPIQEYDTPVYIDTLRAVLGTMKIPILATFN
jgi:cellulase/cellobiase CelA1